MRSTGMAGARANRSGGGVSVSWRTDTRTVGVPSRRAGISAAGRSMIVLSAARFGCEVAGSFLPGAVLSAETDTSVPLTSGPSGCVFNTPYPITATTAIATDAAPHNAIGQLDRQRDWVRRVRSS
jgi:hypothetical protein